MVMMLALSSRRRIFWSQGLRGGHPLATETAADAHDAGLESVESHLLVAGSAADARDAGQGKCG